MYYSEKISVGDVSQAFIQAHPSKLLQALNLLKTVSFVNVIKDATNIWILASIIIIRLYVCPYVRIHE